MIRSEIHEAGVHGVFARPAGDGPFPAVLALGGSEGGVPAYLQTLLVPEGFACLALAYFNTEETQPALVEVPLERIERALNWLGSRPQVRTQGGRVSLLGVSKGGELALLASATFPKLAGPVVAYTPSSVVWQGIDLRAMLPPAQSSWSYRSRALPYVAYPPIRPPTSERGMRTLPIYDGGLDNAAAVAEAAIPIERATGPVLLVSGGDDRVWPADRMCRMVVERMRNAGRERDVEHLNFPDAGHVLFPFGSVHAIDTPFRLELGGSDGATEAAHRTAWPDVVRTLKGERSHGA
jgi:dienelactone hydrolase